MLSRKREPQRGPAQAAPDPLALASGRFRVRTMTASAAGTVDEPGCNVRAKAGLNRSLLDVAPVQIRSMLDDKAA